MRPVSVGFSALVLACCVSFGQSKPTAKNSESAKEFHGTINVVLGNRNGLVVVTDSRLSSANWERYKFEAPKLFQLDDHTVLAIAGFYFEGWPISELPAQPPITLLTDIVDRYLAFHVSRTSISEKAQTIASLFQFSLNLIENMQVANGTPNIHPSPLFLTLAGYENDSISVVQLHLEPVPGLAGFDYEQVPIAPSGICVNQFKLGAEFECSLAGWPEPAEESLDGRNHDALQNPALIQFLHAKKVGKAGDLSLKTLQDLAEYLKNYTAEVLEHPVVGGTTQMAVLSGGKIQSFSSIPSLRSKLDNPIPPGFNVYQEPDFTGMAHPGIPFPIEGGINVSKTVGAMVIQGKLSDVIQPLDNLIFTNTTFENCILTYGGSPMTIFDSNNNIQNCELRVMPGVDPASNVLLKIKRDYPNLKISIGGAPNPARWQMWQN